MVDVIKTKDKLHKEPFDETPYGEFFSPGEIPITNGNAPQAKSNSVIQGNTIRAISGYLGGAGGWVIKTGELRSVNSNIKLDSKNSIVYVGSTTGNHILIDGANLRIRSSNYVAGIAGAGFTLEPDLLEVGNIRARGIIRTACFQKDVISSVGGNFAVIDSDVLEEDMTADDDDHLQIEGNTTFAVGDFLRIKDGTDDEWFEVTGLDGSNNTTDTASGTQANDSDVGTTAWSNPTNASASNDSYATVALGGPGSTTSQYLKVTNFSFSIPTDATITGIEVKIERKATHQNIGASDSAIKIVKADGSFGSENKAVVGAWPTTDTSATYGSSSDLWSETWTPANINDTDFGVAISASVVNANGPLTASIDYVSINVYYTLDGYEVTRDKNSDYGADSNPTWKKGATVTNYKQSGDGLIYMTASDSNAPYLEVQTHAGSPWSALTARLRLGNLNGFLDYSSDLYGIAIGETTKYLKYDPTNGLRIAGGIQSLSYQTAGEDLTQGDSLQLGGKSKTLISQDVYVSQDSPSSVPGTNPLKSYCGVGGSPFDYSFMLFKFDLSELDSSMIDNISSANFKFTVDSVNGVTHNLSLQRATEAWNESTVWNNKPNLSGSDFATLNSVSSTGEKSIDVQTQVEDWLDGTHTNHGFGMSSDYAGSVLYSIDVASSEDGTDFPYLEITFTSGKVYKASAMLSDNNTRWIGFASETTSKGSACPTQIAANVTYLSSLTIESVYYQSDTRGEVSTTPGTNSKKVGFSLSATELLILNS